MLTFFLRFANPAEANTTTSESASVSTAITRIEDSKVIE